MNSRGFRAFSFWNSFHAATKVRARGSLNPFGEFIKPEILIDIVESSGLKLKGTYDRSGENTDFHIPYNGANLQVVCLVFEK